MTIGELESPFSGVVLWNDDGEGLDEEDPSCGWTSHLSLGIWPS